VEKTLVWHGQDIGLKEMDLLRLAEAVTEIYGVTCSLARANRTYCHGHQHGDHELHLAASAAVEGREVVKTRLDRSLMSYYHNNDVNIRKIADYTLDEGKYAPVHPILRNIF